MYNLRILSNYTRRYRNACSFSKLSNLNLIHVNDDDDDNNVNDGKTGIDFASGEDTFRSKRLTPLVHLITFMLAGMLLFSPMFNQHKIFVLCWSSALGKVSAFYNSYPSWLYNEFYGLEPYVTTMDRRVTAVFCLSQLLA